MFTVEATEGKARAGKLKTNHGTVETPFFMPVATKAVGRFVSSDDYHLTNTKTIICNQFLLSLRPGLETFQKMDGIHRFMNYNGVIFTDNGGFQMLRENLLDGTTTNGIWFRSPEGQKIFMRPEKVMEIGQTVNSDVIMAMDCLLPYGASKEEFAAALVKSHRWTTKCKELHNGKQLLFGITQGGTFDDLRIESAKTINALDFDGNAIGGVAIGEAYDTMFHIIDISIPHLNNAKPRYVMGIGKPDQIIECIARGIDIFDSILPQKNGRHGRLFTCEGIVDLEQARYKYDEGPIAKGCKCYTCQRHSKAYLRYLLKKDDPVGKRLLSLHNMHFMDDFMTTIRKEIRDGTFMSFKENFLKDFKKI